MARARSKKKRGKGAQRSGAFARLSRAFNALFLGREDDEASDRWSEIGGICLIGFAIWLIVSMATFYVPFEDPAADGSNWGGQIGFLLADGVFRVVGLGGYLLAFLGLAWGVVLLGRKEIKWASVRLFGALCCVLAIAFLFEMTFGASWDPNSRMPYGPGGWLALNATAELEPKVGRAGLWIMMPAVALVSFMLATEMAFYPALIAFREWADERREERGEVLGRALWIWARELIRGLWDFVRGVGLDEEPEPKKKRKASKKKPKLKLVVEEPVAEEEEEEWDEGEEAEDGEYEDEYDDEAAEYDEEYEDEEYDEDEDEEEVGDEELQPVSAKERVKAALKRPKQRSLDFEPPVPPKGDWKYPPLDLLEAPDTTQTGSDKQVEEAATKLENALTSFRVEAQVVGAEIGPTVTLFELEVAQGTRLNKVTQLSQEIAAALRAKSVRIIAPIPGKATIGIEVPNKKRRMVRMAELIDQSAYDRKFASLPLFLGMDAEGNAIVEDLARMPHLLIAGTTGSGKSVCINTIIASVLLTRSPHDVQMILVDPKMVELQMFSNVPHLMLPVVTDMTQATNVLLWAVEKMEGRYELFKNAGVRNIKGYNALSEEQLKERMGDDWSDERTPRHVPYVMVVVDEFADLMMVSKKEAEQAITRLAQKSRAVGIHVILATQRPSTDVITGVIKGNLPTRIAFQVASKVDSRVILDQMGADKLLGGGDMLYNPPQSSQITRVQGAFVEDDELQGVVDFVCQESAPTFSQELIQAATGTSTGAGAFEAAKEDPMWDDAVRVIVKSRRGSASLLQRALGVGYTRASRLLDMMTEAGIVGAHKGSKAREVMITLDEWEQMAGEPMEQGVGDD